MSQEDLLERLASAFERNNQLLEQLIVDRQPKPKCMPLADAWKELGYKNYKACYRKVINGHYRVGHEVEDRRSPGAYNPEYWLDIEACRERNKVIPAKRSV
ncbi:MAG: hypothetical protein AAGA75_00035 [Cyanobacteria bacterium P01_E01_bin.6]